METFIATAIQTLLTGILLFVFQQKYKARENRAGDTMRAREMENEAREKNRERLMVLLIRLVGASVALGEANCAALKKGKCNEETKRALEYVETVKHENKDFMTQMGIESIF